MIALNYSLSLSHLERELMKADSNQICQQKCCRNVALILRSKGASIQQNTTLLYSSVDRTAPEDSS